MNVTRASRKSVFDRADAQTLLDGLCALSVSEPAGRARFLGRLAEAKRFNAWAVLGLRSHAEFIAFALEGRKGSWPRTQRRILISAMAFDHDGAISVQRMADLLGVSEWLTRHEVRTLLAENRRAQRHPLPGRRAQSTVRGV